jgi:Leucine rich repeat
MVCLDLSNNKIASLPDSVKNMTGLKDLRLDNNLIFALSESIGGICNLKYLNLSKNKLAKLPKSISKLTKLVYINLNSNPLIDLSILKDLPNLETIEFLDLELPRRYWIKFSNWKSEWLLDEDNAEIRRVLIEKVGYEKICKELDAVNLNNWREYTLLKIDGIEAIYNRHIRKFIDREPMVLLKMTCPSTQHIHILRVPPEMTSAEAAITWVNHGIHPDKFAVQT